MTRTAWIVVLAGGAVMSISVGLRQALGLFLAPISTDMMIGRETFALGMGLMNLGWGLAAPFAGALADRHGAARVIVAGGFLYSGGLAVMSLGASEGQLLLGGTLIGLGLSGAGFTVVLGAVGRAAPPERRSTALGVASTFGSFGQFAALPYAHVLIESLGWQVALIALAGTASLICGLAIGVRVHGRREAEPQYQSFAQALGEAGRHQGFWLLTGGFFVCGFHLAFVAVHLPAYLGDQGLPAWLGTAALTIVGLCNMAGTYVCGLLGERYPKKSVLSALYLARAFIFLTFLAVPVSEAPVLLFAAALGFLWLGTVPLTSGVVFVIFGPAYLSTLFGIVFLSHQLGGFLGAWLGGYVYDFRGSYDLVWWFCAALGFLSAALHWPIREQPVARLSGARA